jgi:hypothetical protein
MPIKLVDELTRHNLTAIEVANNREANRETSSDASI